MENTHLDTLQDLDSDSLVEGDFQLESINQSDTMIGGLHLEQYFESFSCNNTLESFNKSLKASLKLRN